MSYEFRLACETGNLELAKKLYLLGYREPTILRGACEFGHYEIVDWIINELSIRNDIIFNIHDREEYAFRWACENGHLHIVIYLLEKFPDINVRIRDDYAFRWSCGNGHINIAIWLLEHYPEIDIHALDESAFKLAAEAGYDYVCEWLYRFGNINLRINNDIIFLLACRNGFINIALFILQICPDIRNRLNNEFNFKWECVNKRFELYEGIFC